jgi:vacuolar-type H+-ATPase catalytic subunit A/Vma1
LKQQSLENELHRIIQSEEQIPKETNKQNDDYLESFAKTPIKAVVAPVDQKAQFMKTNMTLNATANATLKTNSTVNMTANSTANVSSNISKNSTFKSNISKNSSANATALIKTHVYVNATAQAIESTHRSRKKRPN